MEILSCLLHQLLETGRMPKEAFLRSPWTREVRDWEKTRRNFIYVATRKFAALLKSLGRFPEQNANPIYPEILSRSVIFLANIYSPVSRKTLRHSNVAGPCDLRSGATPLNVQFPRLRALLLLARSVMLTEAPRWRDRSRSKCSERETVRSEAGSCPARWRPGVKVVVRLAEKGRTVCTTPRLLN
jgi:hypothetical protein